MKRLAVCLAIVVAAGLAAWRFVGKSAQVAPVPDGDQEIAWIHAATSVSAWERFVTGVNRVARDWPELRIDDRGAFPEATTETPELVVDLTDRPGRLLIRWYKLSKEANATEWAARLAGRTPPPLVVIGGGSSDRAIDLARAMAGQVSWRGDAPLLFFTTATASAINDPNEPAPIDLMRVYAGRSFRMCFTNEQIARAVVDFVWSQPDLRPNGNPLPALAAAGMPSALQALPLLAGQFEMCPPAVSALEWDDDPYSVDLSRQFHQVFHEAPLGRVLVRERRSIPFSVGGQFSPNAWEVEAAQHLLAGLVWSPLERQLLVLPTLAAPARRVLRAIAGTLPLVGRNLVAITGDSINLNNVYRDWDIGWDVRALPVPLVFFAHQNPVGWDWPAGDEDRAWPPGGYSAGTNQPVSASSLAPPTNTDEVLLHRDMIRLMVRAAYGIDPPNPAGLVASADEFKRRLHGLDPPFFTANGDRLGGRGEYVGCLRPQFDDTGHPAFSQVLPIATLEIWARGVNGGGTAWRPVKRLILDYGRANRTQP